MATLANTTPSAQDLPQAFPQTNKKHEKAGEGLMMTSVSPPMQNDPFSKGTTKLVSIGSPEHPSSAATAVSSRLPPYNATLPSPGSRAPQQHLPFLPLTTSLSSFPPKPPFLRIFTTSLLPVKYSNDFYSSTLQPPTNSLTFTILSHDPNPITKPQTALYVSVLALSPSRRSQGLATALLSHLANLNLISVYNVQFLYAHIWEANKAALEWYEKHGFRRQWEKWRDAIGN